MQTDLLSHRKRQPYLCSPNKMQTDLFSHRKRQPYLCSQNKMQTDPFSQEKTYFTHIITISLCLKCRNRYTHFANFRTHVTRYRPRPISIKPMDSQLGVITSNFNEGGGQRRLSDKRARGGSGATAHTPRTPLSKLDVAEIC